MRHEQVTVHVDEGAVLVPFKATGDTLALLHGHDLLAVLTIENGVVSYLKGALRGAVTKKLLFNPCTVEVAQKFVTAILQFFELGIGHTIGNVGNNLRIKVTETNFATVDDRRKVLEEKLLPNLLVDPLDL